MNMQKITNIPPKGTSDWFPEEYQIRKYIFDTWRRVCTQFGYKEYMTPLLEYSEVYKAKSGEDAGGKELMTLTDRAGRELAIRPEMTPSVTRMVTRIYESAPKPLRLFSIANFVRNQKPQRGRNREFWQLNFDIFGSDNVSSDIEIVQIALEIMLAFEPPRGAFTMYINNRRLIDQVLDEIVSLSPEQKVEAVRVLDKWEKLKPEDIKKRLGEIGLEEAQIESLSKYMGAESREDLLRAFPELEKSPALKEIEQVQGALEELGYKEWIKFQPNIIRGFDYYDGMIFEAFDNSPDNNRSLFGGGRYNGLAGIFGSKSFPAVGFAPGDETTKLFLESWGLLEKIKKETKVETIYIPLLDEGLESDIMLLAQKLRAQGGNVELGTNKQGFAKALSYADKQGLSKVVILGTQEKDSGIYKIKDMVSGEETEVKA